MHPRIESRKLMNAVKSIMRQKRLRNLDLANALGVSLATAKRLTGCHEVLSVERLFQICDWLEIPMEDLLVLAQRSTECRLVYLSEEQERFLASDDAAWSLFNFLYNGRTLSEVESLTGATRRIIDQYVRLLEKNGLVSVSRSGKIRVERLLGKMRPGGPLFQKHIDQISRAFASLMQKVGPDAAYRYPDNLWFKASDYEMTREEFASFSKELQELLKKYSDRNRWAHIAQTLDGAGRLYSLTMYYWDEGDSTEVMKYYSRQMPFFFALGRDSQRDGKN